MKVVFFQPYLAAWRIEFLERFIRETSHDVMVIDGGHRSKKDDKYVNGNAARFKPSILWSPSKEISFSGIKYPIYFSPLLFIELIKKRPDVIITEGEINFANNVSISIYCWIFGKRYIWWSLGKVRSRRKTILSRAFNPLMNRLIKGANCIVARNTYAKGYYIENFGVPPEKVFVAPNSMDEQRAREELDQQLDSELKTLKGDGYVMLYVGALTEAKRPHDAVLVLADLIRDESRLRKVSLWFVGDGPMRRELEEMVSQLGLGEFVTFFGRLTVGVGNFFRNADVTLVPGLGGLVINHAMIFGCPVISRRADGTELDLIVDGQTGYLICDDDFSSFSNAVRKIILREDASILRGNCEKLIETSWNMGLMIHQFERAIENCRN